MVPEIDGIVISVDDEHMNAVSGQPLEPGPESKLRTNAPLRSVVDVARHDEERGTDVDAEIHEGVERLKGCVPQGLADLGRDSANAIEGRIEMEVGRVNDSESQQELPSP